MATMQTDLAANEAGSKVSSQARRLSMVTAIVIASMTSIHTAWCCSIGTTPGDDVLRLYPFVMGILIVSWLVSDPALPTSRKPSFDYGLLLWVSFPLLATYHLYAAHRWRGFLIVLGLMMLFLAPYLSCAVIRGIR